MRLATTVVDEKARIPEIKSPMMPSRRFRAPSLTGRTRISCHKGDQRQAEHADLAWTHALVTELLLSPDKHPVRSQESRAYGNDHGEQGEIRKRELYYAVPDAHE